MKRYNRFQVSSIDTSSHRTIFRIFLLIVGLLVIIFTVNQLIENQQEKQPNPVHVNNAKNININLDKSKCEELYEKVSDSIWFKDWKWFNDNC